MTIATSASGWLALVATPIGNLDDMTMRAIETLRQAEVIAAEDTRRALILCTRFDLHARLVPYHAYNEHRRTEALLDEVAAGRRIVVLSDAGTPAISDPGFFIVRAALARGIKPVIIPGVSAVTFAVVACGLPVDRFAFHGFPPVKSGRRRKFLEKIKADGLTAFLFESPYRVNRLLTEIAELFGAETPVALVREATKMHEECITGPVAEVAAQHGKRVWKGEFVVVIGGPAGELQEETEAPPEETVGEERTMEDGGGAQP